MKKILIVDDSEDIHDLFTVLIKSKMKVSFLMDFFFDDELEEQSDEKNKYQITHAYQGEEAVSLVLKAEEEKKPYDLIFMDVKMPPGIDGIETIKRISKKIPNKRFVVCSAFLNREWDIIKKDFKGDAILYQLRKPFTSKKIQKILKEAIK